MIDNKDDANIVRSIIQMGQSLNLRIVAEGVESASHLETLGQFGCDTAQGFYFSRPIPAHEMTQLLRAFPFQLPAGTSALSIRDSASALGDGTALPR